MVMRDDPPNLIDLVEDLPESVTDLVDACLTKTPEERPARPGDVAEALRACLAGS